jgi:hypothetical protein
MTGSRTELCGGSAAVLATIERSFIAYEVQMMVIGWEYRK